MWPAARTIRRYEDFRGRRFPVRCGPGFAYLAGMEVHFTPEREMQLSQIGAHGGTDAERLVRDAAMRLLQKEARARRADLQEGVVSRI